MTDDAFEIVKGDWECALGAAEQIDAACAGGNRCLVTCVEGRNRSGFVAALAIHLIGDVLGDEAIAAVQNNRTGALYNWHFQNALRQRCLRAVQAVASPDGPLP
ncbi:MAG: hypothetical protein JRD89_02470 [Deltaproteobacteria bacterium]|nr:hypothetical protein [Deltaproteobacteria bacterium]